MTSTLQRRLNAATLGFLLVIAGARSAGAQTTLPPVSLGGTTPPATSSIGRLLWPTLHIPDDEVKRFFGQQGSLGFIPQVRWFTESLGDETEGTTNTIAADLFAPTLGPLRIAIGSAVTSFSQSQTADPEATLQQLARGGNFYVNVALPVLRSPLWTKDDPSVARLRAALFVLPQLSMVVPEINGAGGVDVTVYASDVAAEGYVDFSNRVAGLFASARIGYVHLSADFPAPPDVSRNFLLTQWAVGAQIYGVRVSFQGMAGAPVEIRGTKRSARLVFQIFPR